MRGCGNGGWSPPAWDFASGQVERSQVRLLNDSGVMARTMTYLIQFNLYLRLGLMPNQHLRLGQNHLERTDGKIHGPASSLEQLHYPRFVHNPSVGVHRFPRQQRIQRIGNGSEWFASTSRIDRGIL